METFIYVVASNSDGPVKIGHSSNPSERLTKIQLGHPDKLLVFYAHPFAADRTPLMERIIHKALRIHRMKGEWFNINVEDAIAEVQFSAIRYDDHANLRLYL